MLAATNVGINNIWIGNFEPDIIKEKLNIPDNLVAVSLLPLGYKTDDLIKIIDEKLEQLELEEKMEKMNKNNSEKSELEQFKTENMNN